MPEKQRDNYFILLGIDPKESWSDEKFEQTLIQKRAEWSARSKLPGRKGAQYQEYLALVSEIQKIMRDPGQRAKEAEMAKTSQQETPGKVEQEKLITEIDIISSKGFIYESEIQGLVRKYQKFVPESFIRNEINRNNIQINQDVDESNLETLDETQLKRIKGYLETLGHKNIYEFLELSKTTPNNKLYQKAQEKFKQSQSGRKDTITDAQRGLAIESQNIFATEKTRRLYDNSLELEQYKIIKENIQSLAQISYDKILHPKQFDKILKIAQSSGIENVEKAKKVIIKYAREKNLSLEFLDMNNDLSTAIPNYSRETESVRQKQTPPPRPKIPIQIFTTVRVNSRGDIISRTQGKAGVMTENIGNGVSLEMVKIPGGRFLMGSPETEARRDDHEGPQHYVNVPEFFMGKYTVTQAQWQAVMGNNPSRFKGKNRPVDKVNWNDATRFCQKLSEKMGRHYRLPSEAEWEYACRAGTTTPFYFGEAITPELVNYDSNYTYGNGPEGKYREETTNVGIFPPNSFGLYDMHGNVWEWCQDIWHSNYDGAPVDGSAWVNRGNSTRRVRRGGSWDHGPRRCRSAFRNYYLSVGTNDYYFGFRLVSVPPQDS